MLGQANESGIPYAHSSTTPTYRLSYLFTYDKVCAGCRLFSMLQS